MSRWNPVLIQLRDVLSELYDDNPTAKRVAHDAGLDVRQIPFRNRVINTWTEIVKYAQRKNRIHALLSVALKDYEHYPPILTVKEAYERQVGVVKASVQSSRVLLPPGVQVTSVQQWVTQHGFKEHPFAYQQADRESRLSEYFVDTPFYDDILDRDRNPRSMVIAARRGSGKSAHRIMVARSCRPHNPASRSLAVEYISFGWLAREMTRGQSESLLEQHFSHILKATVEALIGTLVTDDSLARRMPIANIDRLKWFWLKYGSTFAQPSTYFNQLQQQFGESASAKTPSMSWTKFQLAWSEGKLSSFLKRTSAWDHPGAHFLGVIVDKEPERLKAGRLSTDILYGQLVDLALSTGFDTVYVLIDRTDESYTLSAYPERVAAMLLPLIAELLLMEVAGTAFKFFLPLEVAQILVNDPSVREDRIPFRELRWTSDALRELLAQRLNVYSDNRITHIGELCEGNLATVVESEIVDAAQGVPRHMLRLAEHLVLVHCQLNPDKYLFQGNDWKTALETWT